MTDHIIDFRTISDEELKNYGDKIGVDWNTIPFDQFKQGCIVEMEHDSGDPQTDIVNDPLEIARIALKHLQEDSEYYSKLESVEGEETFSPNEKGEGVEEFCDSCDRSKHNCKCKGGDNCGNGPCSCNEGDAGDAGMGVAGFADKKEEPKEETELEPGTSPKIRGGGLLRILQSIVPLIFKIHNELIPEGMESMIEDNPFEVLSDDDFDDSDSIVQHFKNDLGGVKGIIKIIHKKEPDTIEQFANILGDLHEMRKAEKIRSYREVFASISLAKQGRATARSQVFAAQKLQQLASDANDVDEHSKLMAAKKAILAGTPEMFDAAAYRIKELFASYIPKENVRIAYTTINTQDGEPYLMCPKAKHQIGTTVPMETSKCRDNCIDSRMTADGKITCAYAEWIKLADNYKSLNERLEVHHPKDNEDNLLTLNKSLDTYTGKRFKPLTKNEKNWEERFEDKGRPKVPEDSIENQLEDASEANLGHHGEPEEKTKEEMLKTAVAKPKKVDPTKDETLGEQIEQVHEDEDYDDETIEAMLNDSRVGLSDDELDMLVEQMLEDYRDDLPAKYKK